MNVTDYFKKSNFESRIDYFFNVYLENNDLLIYNEFSLQHELGIFLRNELKCYNKDYKVEFERNINIFNIEYDEYDVNYCLLKNKYDYKYLINELKHEIDICIYSKNKNEIYAIELKYPSIMQNKEYAENKKSNGAIPIQMYSFIKDIKFMETLKKKDKRFIRTYSIVLVNSLDDKKNKLFFEYRNGLKTDGIYQYFRGKDNKLKSISGIIDKPVGRDKDKKCVYIKNPHLIKWKTWGSKDNEIGKYYIDCN